MGLIGNRVILDKLPVAQVGGLFSADIRTQQNWHVRENADQKSSIPNGYNAGGAWLLPQQPGGLSLFYSANGNSNVVFANVAGGLNGSSSIQGDGDIVFAQAGLIVSAVAAILATSNLSSSIRGVLTASATLAGQGNVVAALGALASAVAAITGNSPVSCSFRANGSMAATIKSFGDLSPEGLAAAVWNSLAASFNTAGTMGNKVNSAASAGDPWGTVLPASYVGSEAGNILAQIKTLITELHTLRGLDASNPSTATPSSIIAGDIEIAITGDGENSTTMTRV